MTERPSSPFSIRRGRFWSTISHGASQSVQPSLPAKDAIIQGAVIFEPSKLAPRTPLVPPAVFTTKNDG